jgi:hypothetical protein
VRLTTHLHLVPRLRKHGVVPPLPQYVFMVWCVVKHRDVYLYLSTCGMVFILSMKFQLSLSLGNADFYTLTVIVAC